MVGALVLTLVCLPCALAGIAFAGWRPGEANLPLGYRAGVCVTFSDARQLHVTWNRYSLIVPARSPIFRSRSGCGVLPWLPALPASGALIFPP